MQFTPEGLALMQERGVDLTHLAVETTVAVVCERYHKLPSEVECEDYAGLVRMLNVQDVIDREREKQARKHG